MLFVISIGYQPSLMSHYLVGWGLTCVRIDVLGTYTLIYLLAYKGNRSKGFRIFVIYATLWTTKVKKRNEIHKVGSPDMVGLG